MRMCFVKNRSASRVVYSISEDGIRREFAPGEEKQIPYDELVKLTYRSGGRELMEQFLQVRAAEDIKQLNLNTEQEYSMSNEEIIALLRHGSLDEFLDCLDFAPVGVIDLVKVYSVNLPLTDYEKRKALKEKIGFDVDAAIRHVEEEKAEDNQGAQQNQEKRRRTESTPVAENAAPRRRVVKEEQNAEPADSKPVSKYKVVTKPSN